MPQAQIVATVASISGAAFARDQDGKMRRLKAGDAIREGEAVVAADGGEVTLLLADGRQMIVAPGETVSLDAEVVALEKPDAFDSAVVNDQKGFEKITKALTTGGDLDALLEDPAAGAAGPGGNEGHTFVEFLRVVEAVDPLAFQFGTPQGRTVETFDGGALIPTGGTVDVAGTPGTPGTPSVVVNIVDPTLNVADNVSTVTFTFSEVPFGFTAIDIIASGGTVSGLTATADPKVFTATFTADPGYTGVGSVSVGAGSYSNALGNPGTAGSDTVGIDTAAPVASITLDPNITADDIISAAEAGQTIAITGTVGGDVQVGDTVTLTINGTAYTGPVLAGHTFSIDVPGSALAADPDRTIDASVTTTDAGGNSATGVDTEGYSVATGSPSVVVNIVDPALNVADNVSTVTFTFSEVPFGFTAIDIIASGGTVSGLTATADPKVFTATFTADPGYTGVGSVSVGAGSYSNALGNPGTAGSDTVGIDTAAPVASITLDPNITADDIISAAEAGQTIAITGTVGGDVQVGDTVTLTINGTAYTGPVLTGHTFSIDVPGSALAADPDRTIDASVTTTDAGGNSATGVDTEGYSVATGSPSVVVNIVDPALNVADNVSTVTFTFSEVPFGFTAIDIIASGGTVSGLTATADPKVFTATFTADPGYTGVGSVSVGAGSYSNALGNPGTAGSDTVGIDTAAPVASITLDPNITADDIISAAEAGQTIAITGTVGGDVQVGDTVTLTINGTAYTGPVLAGHTFSIDVPGSALAADPDRTIDASVTTTDAGGNSATGVDTEGYSVATGSPSVVVNIVDPALNVADNVSTVTFTFSEVPFGFTAIDIIASGGTVSGLTATADPKVFTATFTADPGYTGVGSVSVGTGSYSNALGNPGTAGSDTVGIDTAAPVASITLDPNITADDIISAAEAGQTIAITGTVGGDVQVGDTVTLTINGTAYTGPVLTGHTFSIDVPGSALAADPDRTIDASVTTTDAGGNSATGVDTEGYSVATGSPSVVVNIVDPALNVADNVSTVTFTFSEVPFGFTAIDIIASGGTVSGLTATADPKVFTATFTADPGYTGVGSVSVGAGSYSNALGNPGTAGSDTVGIDTAAPVASITLDPNITADDIISAAEAGQTIAITGTVGGDVQVGDTVTLTINGTAYTGPVLAGHTFSIDVPGSALAADPDRTIDASVTTTDAGGNSATGVDTEGYSVATGSPSVVVNIVDPALNVADNVSTVTFTFSEVPFGFTAIDIIASGGTVSGLTATADPKVFTATFTADPGYTGVGSVSVGTGSYSNALGNPGTAGSDTVGIDTAAPVASITLDPNITADDIISAAEAGQTIAITGTVGGDVQVGDTVTLTINGTAYTGPVLAGHTFSIDVPGSALAADPDRTIEASVTTTDAGGNSATGVDTEGYGVATGSPSVVVNIVDPALNVADNVSTVTFTFSEVPFGFTAIDIVASGGTVSGLTATADPKVFTATFTADPGYTGVGSVSVGTGSYSNALGNPGTAGSDTVGIDTAAPVASITLDPNITADDIISAAEAGQTIAITGTVGGDVQVGDTVTLTINGTAYTGPVLAGHTFSIDVPGSALAADPDRTIEASVTTTDAAGNSATGVDTEGYSVNTAGTAPTLSASWVDYWQFNEGAGASTTNYNPLVDQVATITDNNKAGLNPAADLSPTWTTGRNGSTAIEFHGVGGASAQRDGGWLALAPSVTEALAGHAASQEAALSFWIKTTQVGSGVGWNSPSVIGTENNGWIADIQWGSINAAGQIGLGMRDDVGVMSSTSINDGVWHQVVVTHDFETGATRVFVDGVLEASRILNPGIIVPNNFLGLGVTADDGGAAHRFLNGTLEDVRIYDQTLTASQIQAIYETELMGNQSNVIANDGQTIRFALDVHDAVSTVLSGLVSGTVVSSGAHSALVDASGTVDISGWNATEVALSDYGSGSYMITVSATNATNGTVSKQLSVVNDSDSVVGTAAADSLVGNANHNVLAGGDGNDVLSGLAGNDMLIGGAGDDRLIGGAGSDALTGGLGSDTFAWSLADQGTVAIPARDTITDFSPAAQAAGGDVLDLRDLLPSATDAATLDNYLNFSKSGLDTVIDVRPTGAAGGVTQQIVLSNVDLTASGTLNDVAIIQDLLTKGKLLTD